MSVLVGHWAGEDNLVDSVGGNSAIWEMYTNGSPPVIAGDANYAAGAVGQCFKCRGYYSDIYSDPGNPRNAWINTWIRIEQAAYTDDSLFTLEERIKWTINNYLTTVYKILEVSNAARTAPSWSAGWVYGLNKIYIRGATDITFSYTFSFGVFYKIKIQHLQSSFKVFVDGVEIAPDTTATCLMSSSQTSWIFPGIASTSGGLDTPVYHDEIRIYREELIMIKELECFLAKKQATYGAQGDDLTGDNYFPALPDSKVEIITAMTDIETVSATYDHDLAVRGFVNANAELSCYMRSLGDATEPDYALLARASGWAVAGPTAGKYSITPIVNPTTATGDDLEVWHYLGGIGSNASVLTKIGNVVGNWKITGDVGKPVVFALTGAKGLYVSQAAATMVTSVVKDRTLIPAALPVTVSINSVVYKLMKFSFEGGNTVEQYIDCAETYGFGDSEITKKKIKFAFTCYANAALANPLDAVIAGAVVADVSIIWGKALYKTKIVVDDPQFTDCKTVDVGGLTGWEVTGNATANDITITQNDDHV